MTMWTEIDTAFACVCSILLSLAILAHFQIL